MVNTAKKMIMVVEDDMLIRSILAKVLQSNGYSVVTAKDGKEGLRQFYSAKKEIQLVLSDLNMPNMGGIDMLKDIRKNEHDVPLIILTANDEISVAMEALRCGADDYLVKDNNIAQTVIFSIKEVFKKKQLQDENKKLLKELSLKNKWLENFNDGFRQTINALS